MSALILSMTKCDAKMEYRWIIVGEIVSSQGNKGEVKVVPHTDYPERFSTMEYVRLFERDGSAVLHELKIESCRFHKGAIILKLEGIDTIDQALSLKGLFIKVAKDELVELPPGEHYVFELVGLKVVTSDGLFLGHISDVLRTGANDVYVVKPVKGVTKLREILLPVIDDVVIEIDIDKGEVLVQLLDGVLE